MICLRCQQYAIDHPSVYDAIANVAEVSGRDPAAVAADFFRRYHRAGHTEEKAA